MRSLNRKGVSEIVQIASIIALSIIALTSVWSYVSDLSNNFENQLSPIVDCVQLQTRISNACINSEGKIEVIIDKPEADNIDKIILTGQNNFKTSCGGECSTCIFQDSGTKTIFLENSNLQAGNKIYLTNEICPSIISEATILSCQL